MSILYINTGSSANAGDGDSLRTAFTKINENFQFIDSAGAGNGGGGDGYTGSQGEYGYAGSAGFVGSKGYVGSRGAGYTGSASTLPGYTGSKGYVGSAGFAGSQGVIGPIGYIGSASTEVGYAGSQGEQGPIGYVGSQSTEIGYTGSQGFGEQGFVGSQGTVGYVGSRGDLGFTGSTGPEGPQGFSPAVVPGGIYIQLDDANPIGTNLGYVYASTLTQTFVNGQAVRLRANIMRMGNTPIAIGVISQDGGAGALLVLDENAILTMYQMSPGYQTPISQQYDLSGVLFGVNRYLTMEWQVTPDSVNGSVLFGSVVGVGQVEMEQVDPYFLNLSDIITNGPFYLCAYSGGGRQDIADIAYELGIGIGGANGYTGSAGAGFTGSASTAIGYTGSSGTDGYAGSIGFTGSAGFVGSASTAAGYAGSEGFTGSQGYDGSKGTIGYAGSRGVLGYTGSRGFAGSQGFSGSQGDAGFIGSFGYTGSQGDQGIQGDQGQDGATGFTGSAGFGFTGSQGVGYTGSRSTLPGYAGSQGYTGSSGAYAAVGFTGSQGAAGVGVAGDRGYTGSASTVAGYTGSAGTGSVDLSAVNQNIIPSSNSTYNLGSPTRQWKSLYVSTNTVYIGNVPITVNTTTNTLQVGTSSSTNVASELYVREYVAQHSSNFNGGTITAPLILTDATQSVSTTTGALQVTGGVGIGGDVHIGGTTAGAIGSGALTVAGGAYVYGTIYTYGGVTAPGGDFSGRSASFTADSSISSNTISTSTTTGALRVSGGVGIGGDIYAGNIYSNGTLLGAAGTGNGSVIQSDTAPVANTSTIWYDTVTGRTYVYFDGAWVDSNPAIEPTTATIDLSAVDQDIVPSIDKFFNLGSASHQWKSLYVSTNTIYIGGVALSVNTSTKNLIVDGAPIATVTTWSTLADKTGFNGPSQIALGHTAGQNNQGNYALAIGYTAGETNQGQSSVAVGNNAGHADQGYLAVAVGDQAGQRSQGIFSVAVGYSAAQNTQSSFAVAIGMQAGSTYQGESTVAVGRSAGGVSQGNNAVAVGQFSANDTQGANAVAIGSYAGGTAQGLSSVAIGATAGANTQSDYSIAIGLAAGRFAQGGSSIAIGQEAARSNQGYASIAIGDVAGQNTQSNYSVAIGMSAGQYAQGDSSIAIGKNAGGINQKELSVAIGYGAGNVTQGISAVSIGSNAGAGGQGDMAVAIGNNAGVTGQSTAAIAIGSGAAPAGQGFGAIAIGVNACETGYQPANSIIIDASNSGMPISNAGLYIAPVRNDNTNTTTALYYNTDTKELTYAPAPTPTPAWANITDINNNNGPQNIAIGQNAAEPVTQIGGGFNSIIWNPTLNQFIAVGHSNPGNSYNIWTSPDGVTWTQQFWNNTHGGHPDFSSIVWSDTQSQYVAVGSSNNYPVNTALILTSPDGITWIEQAVNLFPGGLSSVAWNGTDQYVAGGVDLSGAALILTSPDGVTWTQHDPDFWGANFKSVCWNSTDNIFLAVGPDVGGGSGDVFYSSNGVNWIHPTSVGNVLNSVIWDTTNAQYVVADNSGIFTSPDAIDWTQQTTGDLSSVIWNPTLNQYVAVGADPTGHYSLILTSPDGITWTQQSTTFSSGSNLTCVAWNGSNYVAMSTDGNAAFIITSPDSVSWTQVLTQGQSQFGIAIGASAAQTKQGDDSIAIGRLAGQNTQGGNSIAIGRYAGQNTQGTQSVAIGPYAGQVTQQDNAIAIGNSAGLTNQGANAIAIGNGAGYASQTSSSIILNATGSAFNDSGNAGLYIAPIRNDITATTTALYYNTDTKELTYGPTPTPTTAWADIKNINNDNGPQQIAIGVGAGQTAGQISGVLESVTWANGQYVAVGKEVNTSNQDSPYALFLTSPDGSSWTQQAIQQFNYTYLNVHKVIWDGTQYVAVGGGFNQTFCYTSPDGITWTEISGDAGYIGISDLAFNGSTYVLTGQEVSTGAGIWTSSDLITWTRHALGVDFGYNRPESIAWNGTQLVAVGWSTNPQPGIILTSPDGVTWTQQAAGLFNTNLISVIWDGTQFVAVGGASSANFITITSPDGVVWTQQLSEFYTGGGVTSLTYNGTDQYLLVGSSDYYPDPGLPSKAHVRTSANLTSWTTQNNITEGYVYLNSATYGYYGSGQYVAVGYCGGSTVIYTSSNGVTWTQQASVTWNENAVAIGAGAGSSSQHSGAVAIGHLAGQANQGDNSIAIGREAGRTNQASNTIILNALGGEVDGVGGQTNSFYVAPVRNDNTNTTTALYYNPNTFEISYAPATISLATLQAVITTCTSFAEFKAAILGL